MQRGAQRQWHQSAIRVWRSNYINFILEHSKITHKWRCSKRGVWGSWLWLFSHHDSDSTLSGSTTAHLTKKRAALAGRYGRKLVVGNPSYWAKSRASRHPDRSRDFYSRSEYLCRWRDKSCQPDQEPRPPLLPHVFVLFT
ncbi:hypothetical protein Zmor_021473 [Zophobas morio]|uniref:Uncharacterized protein n=1 Tax=Zophobas morio TaxID=2755281 RepID=A0AA38I633_9CUCU|nr:hypothetical protein Zmor_021473 [Zophobas morio]